ncbi:MAG: tRNA dihydrouridine synthase [Kiritimatiellia bacterium]
MKYVLAPLAGFTDAPFRRMCHEGGADLSYTEMVSAAALAHGHGATRHLMETMAGEGPVACQIFGAKEEEIARATRLVAALRTPEGHPRFVELNLNAGCPMKKVTQCGAGAKLAEEPAKVHRLLKAMTENTDLPVTLKTRLGPHPKATTAFELLDAAQTAGAQGIAFHARYTSQLHGGPLHLDVLADLVARARIPVAGNGSVVNAQTAREMARTGVSALLIGRAALANPCLFAALKAADGADGTPSPADVDATTLCARHLAYVLAFRAQLAAKFPEDRIPSPDGFAAVKMHTHLFRYFNGRPGAAALRARLNSTRTLTEIRDILSAVKG